MKIAFLILASFSGSAAEECPAFLEFKVPGLDRASDALIDAMSSLPDPNAAQLKQPDERED